MAKSIDYLMDILKYLVMIDPFQVEQEGDRSCLWCNSSEFHHPDCPFSEAKSLVNLSDDDRDGGIRE